MFRTAICTVCDKRDWKRNLLHVRLGPRVHGDGVMFDFCGHTWREWRHANCHRLWLEKMSAGEIDIIAWPQPVPKQGWSRQAGGYSASPREDMVRPDHRPGPPVDGCSGRSNPPPRDDQQKPPPPPAPPPIREQREGGPLHDVPPTDRCNAEHPERPYVLCHLDPDHEPRDEHAGHKVYETYRWRSKPGEATP